MFQGHEIIAKLNVRKEARFLVNISFIYFVVNEDLQITDN